MTAHRRTAFTLLEILVVMGVIGVLLGILVPSLTRARSVAKRAACSSNLRHVGIAVHCYAQQFNGSIPYGPKAPPALTAGNFYPATGTPTSLISLLNGEPVGAGLLLDDYLSNTPQALFCPATDQPVDTGAELEKVGRSQAQASYYYRHASVARRFDPAGGVPRPEHVRLDDLGRNRKGKPMRVLALDTQFDVSSEFAAFGVVPRTHHGRRGVNTLYSDGSVGWHANENERFTVRLDTVQSLINPFDAILSTFEAAE